jgi:hypothetical protein
MTFTSADLHWRLAAEALELWALSHGAPVAMVVPGMPGENSWRAVFPDGRESPPAALSDATRRAEIEVLAGVNQREKPRGR